MSESFGRIKDWAVKHPYIAVAILAAVILAGYLTYRAMGSSRSSLNTDSVGEAEDESSALGGSLSGGEIADIPSYAEIPVAPMTAGGGGSAVPSIPALASMGGQSSSGEVTTPSDLTGIGEDGYSLPAGADAVSTFNYGGAQGSSSLNLAATGSTDGHHISGPNEADTARNLASIIPETGFGPLGYEAYSPITMPGVAPWDYNAAVMSNYLASKKAEKNPAATGSTATRRTSPSAAVPQPVAQPSAQQYVTTLASVYVNPTKNAAPVKPVVKPAVPKARNTRATVRAI